MKMKTYANLFGMLAAAVLIQTVARADELGSTVITNAIASDTRYGFFNGLDHRSAYSQGDFPEPFLVDDSGLEINEARLDWVHTKAGNQHADTVTAEVEKGFGNLTLEIEVPYERDWDSGAVSQGIGNIDLGARYPFYQYVSDGGFFDTTFGGAMEVGIPASSAISINPEFVPKMFNDTKVGDHFTMQSIYGWSTLTGGGADGGAQTFEDGFDFGWTIQHSELPLPGVQQFIPMFELVGETPLNKANSGQTSLTGNACFRLNLKAIGRVQPRLGFGYIFPMNNNAREAVHNGIVTSLVFEY
ncbi:MAG TPA: hypothetical protein VIK62_08995 [Verrucomicrobiae bacterium]